MSMLMTIGPYKKNGSRKTNTGGNMYSFSKKSFLVLGAVFLTAFMFLGCPNGDDPAPPRPIAPEIVATIVHDEVAGTMTISWEAVSGATSFEIFHGGSRFTRDFTWVEYIDDGRTSFTHTTPNPNRFENYYRIIAWNANFEEVAQGYISLRLQLFGPTVLFFDAEYDDPADIAAEVNRIHDTYTLGHGATSHGNRFHFTDKRYLIFFTPGDYNFPAGTSLRIGFYTTVAGLGRFPSDTRFHNAAIEVPPHLPDNNATQTFWRSIENLELVSGPHFRWAVSQSAPTRRMMVRIPTIFHFNMGWGSGGFVADSWLGGTVAGGSQQQWYIRNTHFNHATAMTGVTWNNTIQASTGSLPANDPNGAVTIVGPAPILREQPFLFLDNAGEFKMFVPGVRTNAEGISWNDGSGLPGMNVDALLHNDGMGPGDILDFLDTFYITRAEVQGINHVGLDNAASINAQLALGNNIFVVPGRYNIEAPIVVNNPDTIVMGKGWPALWPTPGNRDGVMFVADVPGVTISGLLFDTTTQSVYSLTVGHTGAHTTTNVPATNPILLANLIMRVGGQLLAPNHVDISVLINSNNVIGDKLWLWRADHNGLPNGFNSIDWHINTSINGIVVFGNDVHMYGLFVEHYHQYNTLWLGERGRVFFYQNELPYDPHYQRQYTSHVGLPGGDTLGWAQFKVDNRVTDFRAYGLGMYAVFLPTSPNRPNGVRELIRLQNAIEVPHHPGVVITKAVITNIGASVGSDNNPQGWATGINSVINGVGDPVVGSFGTSRISSFSNGVGTLPGSVVVNATWSPPDEVHWVEDLIINSSGIVTANPRGGLPYFSVQRGTIGTPGPSWNQPLPPYLN